MHGHISLLFKFPEYFHSYSQILQYLSSLWTKRSSPLTGASSHVHPVHPGAVLPEVNVEIPVLYRLYTASASQSPACSRLITRTMRDKFTTTIFNVESGISELLLTIVGRWKVPPACTRHLLGGWSSYHSNIEWWSRHCKLLLSEKTSAKPIWNNAIKGHHWFETQVLWFRKM